MSSGVGRFLLGTVLIVGSILLPGSTLLGSAFLFNLAVGTLQLAGLSLVSSALVTGSLGNENRGRKINRADTNAVLPVIYGEVVTGLLLVDTRVDDASNDRKDLYIVGALCHGEIEAIEEIWFDDRLAFDAAGVLQDAFKRTITLTPPPPTVQNMATAEKHLGTDSQTVSSLMNTAFPSEWTTNHRGRGIAYLVLKLTYDEQIYPTGIPNVTVKVRGKKCFDPRTSTTIYTQNPIVQLRDYLVNARYGLGAATAELQDADFQTLANFCEEQVSIPPSGTQDRFQGNGALNAGQELKENVRRLLTACRGALVYENGTFRPHIARAVAATGIVWDESAIIGDWSFRTAGTREAFNLLRGKFVNPDKRYEVDEVQWPEPSVSNTFLTTDNGFPSERSIDLPFTNSYHTAKQILLVLLKESRQGLRVQVTCTEAALEARVGDRIQITHPTPGWTAKDFWVVAMAVLEDGAVRVALAEYEPTAYDYDTLTEQDTIPDTNLPDPQAKPPKPATQAFTTGTSEPRIRVAVGLTAYPWYTRVDVEARRSDWANYRPYPSISPSSLIGYIDGVEDGETWAIRTRTRNMLGVYSDWVTGTHVAVILPPAAFGWSVTPEDGAISYLITFETAEYVVAFSRENAAAAGPNPTRTPAYRAGEARVGLTNVIRIGVAAGNYLRTILVGYAKDGRIGEISPILETQEGSSGMGPSQDPTLLAQELGATSSSIPFSFENNGDTTSTPRLYVDGELWLQLDPGDETGTLTGLPNPNQTYSVEVELYLNGQPSARDQENMTTAQETLPALSCWSAYGAKCEEGAPEMGFIWVYGAGTPAGAYVAIERAPDVGGSPGTWADLKDSGAGATEENDSEFTSGLYWFRATVKLAGWLDSTTSSAVQATYGACEPAAC